ncbi:flagellar basal body protein [Methylocystis parvus]|uniref:flagellar basal body protein n=1 Tax=Methylocystis parvus TaxID=134 RepID=UPI003C73752D
MAHSIGSPASARGRIRFLQTHRVQDFIVAAGHAPRSPLPKRKELLSEEPTGAQPTATFGQLRTRPRGFTLVGSFYPDQIMSSTFGLFNTSVMGMSAQADALANISENIANSSTVGYKRATTHFLTVLNGFQGADQFGGGVYTRSRYDVTSEGADAYRQFHGPRVGMASSSCPTAPAPPSSPVRDPSCPIRDVSSTPPAIT